MYKMSSKKSRDVLPAMCTDRVIFASRFTFRIRISQKQIDIRKWMKRKMSEKVNSKDFLLLLVGHRQVKKNDTTHANKYIPTHTHTHAHTHTHTHTRGTQRETAPQRERRERGRKRDCVVGVEV